MGCYSSGDSVMIRVAPVVALQSPHLEDQLQHESHHAYAEQVLTRQRNLVAIVIRLFAEDAFHISMVKRKPNTCPLGDSLHVFNTFTLQRSNTNLKSCQDSHNIVESSALLPAHVRKYAGGQIP